MYKIIIEKPDYILYFKKHGLLTYNPPKISTINLFLVFIEPTFTEEKEKSERIKILVNT